MAFLNQNKGFTVKTPLSFAHNFLEKNPVLVTVSGKWQFLNILAKICNVVSKRLL